MYTVFHVFVEATSMITLRSSCDELICKFYYLSITGVLLVNEFFVSFPKDKLQCIISMVDINGFQLGPKHPYRTAVENIILLNKVRYFLRPQ